MSLTPEAIQTLVNNGNAPLFLDQLKNAETSSQVIAIPSEYKLQDLEAYQECRNSLRGKFETNVIDEFIKYNKDHAEDGTKTFVDADTMKAETIFDVGTRNKAGHQRHRASLSLKQTAPYKALLNLSGSPMPQKEMAEWLEDYSEFLTAFSSDGQVIDMDKASAAIRDLNFEVVRGSERQVQDFSQQQSEYERVATKTKEDLVIPAAFVFTCEPYHGLKLRKFEMRLSIVRNEILTLRIKRLEETQELMAFEFLEIIVQKQEELEMNTPTYIGEF